MALASSNLAVLMAHPFVLMLKPAVAMSAQPDMTVRDKSKSPALGKGKKRVERQ